jgi:hypothetical protein
MAGSTLGFKGIATATVIMPDGSEYDDTPVVVPDTTEPVKDETHE